jgi:hypothetical protein
MKEASALEPNGESSHYRLQPRVPFTLASLCRSSSDTETCRASSWLSEAERVSNVATNSSMLHVVVEQLQAPPGEGGETKRGGGGAQHSAGYALLHEARTERGGRTCARRVIPGVRGRGNYLNSSLRTYGP